MLSLAVLLAAAEPLSLEQAWSRAQSASPLLRAAAVDVAVAEAEGAVSSRWLSDPSLSVSFTSDALAQSEGEQDINGALSQELRWPMEVLARSAAARATVDAASAEREAAALSLWRALALAYADVVAGQEQRRLRVSLQEIAERVREAASARAKSGQAPEIDAAFADVDAAAAAAAVAEADATLAEASARLCRLLGDATCDIEVSWPTLAPPADDDAALLASIEARPDVRAALERTAAAQQSVEAEGWRRLPAPTLGLSGALERSVVEDQVDDDQLLGVSVSVPLPLFSWGQGNTAVAAAERDRREAELAATRIDALTEAHAALASWQAARRAVGAWQGAEHRFEQSLRWLSDGYLAGGVPLDELLSGRDRIARARLESIAARTREVKAAAEARAALGVLP